MSKYPTMMISKIDGIDKNALNVVSYEKDGKRTWAIKNFFGKTSPFFDNYFNPYVYNENTLLCLGEQEGKKELYVFEGSSSEDSDLYWKVPPEGKIESFKELDDKSFLVGTNKGEYLLDRMHLRRKSDFFNNISLEDNRYLFEKRIDYLDKSHIYFGEVTKDGKIKPFLYDVETNHFIDTPLITASGIPYDQLDIEALKQRIRREDSDRRDQLKTSLDTLKKLNGDYSRR